MPADFSPLRMAPVNCPVCQAELSAATDVRGGDAQPKPDDLTICLYCTAPLRFDADLRPVRLSQADIGALDHVTRGKLVSGLHAAMAFRRAHPGRP